MLATPGKLQLLFTGTVPSPLVDGPFLPENPNQSERKYSIEVQVLIVRICRNQVRFADQFWNHAAARLALLARRRVVDVIPVQQCEKIALTIAGDPCAS